MNKICYYLAFICFINCVDQKDRVYQRIEGETMGTTYHLILDQTDDVISKSKVDSILVKVNLALSTYIPESIISKFNNAYEEYLEMHSDLETLFIENHKISEGIHKDSEGAFDPTVMPIVNYWGFGYTGKDKISVVDSQEVKRIMQYVGFDKLILKDNKLLKTAPEVQIDFSSVAKGFGVDLISSYFDGLRVKNYYVEIGGELFTKGVNEKGEVWKIGISVPKEGVQLDEFQQIIEVNNRGIATSGNYRNFYESNGNIYSHTINPKTGFPERTKLLSATIIAPNCALADGYATACMVLGLDKSIELINLHKEIEGILVFSDINDDFQVFDSTIKSN